MKWKTDEIVLKLNEIPDVNVEVGFQRGDWTTTEIIVSKDSIQDESIFISGFNCSDGHCITDPNDVEVEMVEVSDGFDSRGGLNSGNHEIIQLYADVRKKLSGFSIVDNMDDYY